MAVRLVMTRVKFSIAMSWQTMIVSYLTVKDAWDRLEKVLSSLCTIHVNNLQNKLCIAKKTSGMSMTDYLVSIRTTVDALATVGAPVPDGDVVGYICIKSTLQAQTQFDLTFHDLVSMLIH